MTPEPNRARMYAEVVHAGQLYNAEVPYTYHLGMVVDVLQRFGFRSAVLECAAWLHDAIEDRGVSYNDIKKRFGEPVADLVFAVSSELGKNRGERNKKTYPKIRGNFEATVLKLADRIANVEYGLATGGKNEMYAKEFPEFEEGIRAPFDDDPRKPGLDAMWATLRRLLRPES